MRRKAIESDLIIVNHHLFFADLSIKQQAGGAPDAGILPDACAVIFDEAHELEDIASNYFGIGLSTSRFDELARDTELLLRAKHATSSAVESSLATLRERSKLFFAALPATNDWVATTPGGPSFPDSAERVGPRGTSASTQPQPGRMPFTSREDFLEDSGDLYLSVINALTRLEGELDRIKNVEETPGLRKRTTDIRTHLKFLLESTTPTPSSGSTAAPPPVSAPPPARTSQGLPHPPPGHPHRRLRAPLPDPLRNLPLRHPHLRHPHRRRPRRHTRLQAHLQTPRP